MRSRAGCYDDLRAYCESVPLVDCHDHTRVCAPKHSDPIRMIIGVNLRCDMLSVSSEAEVALLEDEGRSLDERWPILEKVWSRTCHTGFAQVARRVLRRFHGEEELSLGTLERLQDRLLDLTDEKVFDSILEEAGIAVRLVSIAPVPITVLDGLGRLPPRSKLVVNLPEYHGITNHTAVQTNVAPLGYTVNSLDAYLDACGQLFARYRDSGAVAFKDASAYARTLDYGNPTRAAAEGVFNRFMADPRRSASHPDEARPLGDFLFHRFMDMARDMDLPVQIHTGHLTFMRNDIARANAIGLTRVIELHRDVRFDLFHANWPYSAEIVYLGKNYPNVTIDFCWANIVDPVYCQRLFREVLACVPHGKIHGYGSDFDGLADRAWAHADMARDNIAIALADMVEAEYLDLDEAREVAHAWLFGNAREFFRLDV